VTSVSLIIPTRDRPGPLGDCLAALSGSFPAGAETIVVSDGGRASVEEVVAPFVEELSLRLLEVEPGGPAWARNRGVEAAQGSVVAFTDDDCRPRPGWLAAIAGGVVPDPPRGVGGSTFNGLPDSPCDDAAQLVLELLSRYDRARTGIDRFLPSNNCAFPRAALLRLGGFDERFRTAEDRELCRRWRLAGYELGRVPHAEVEHDANLSLGRFVRKFMAYGRGAAQFHGSGADPGLRESLGFHLRLPRLLLPELRQRGVARGAAVAGLLVLWELVNVVGFVAQRGRRGRAPARALVAARKTAP